MAEIDWTAFSGGLTTASLKRGVTYGITPPPGGGSFVYGYNSVDTLEGAAGMFANQVNFAPMAKGGSVRGCVKRGVSGGNVGFSPFLAVGIQGSAIADNAYLLGLTDEEPYRIALKTGAMATGMGQYTNPQIKRLSIETFLPDRWFHLRIDMVVNLTGDVILDVWQNDLTLHPIGTAPDWQPVAGMGQLVDDVLGVNTGSFPYTSGRAGIGCWKNDVTRRVYFDQLEVIRQL